MAIDYHTREWKDDQTGGTPIDAANLNRMEQGIANACAGVDGIKGTGGVSADMIADGSISESKLSSDLRDFVSQTQLYSDESWLVMQLGPFMYARCYHVATAGSGSWESTSCPFSIPEGLRPATETMAPVCTENGGSTTGVIKADASGGLMVQNMGSTTSAEARSGVLVWIPGK